MDQKMANELLVEIGTEEIPSGYLEAGVRAFKDLVESFLAQHRIVQGGGLEAYGSPRRLVVFGREIADKQEDQVQEITGPPKNVAFDEKGEPTKAARGFAEKQGISLEDLGTIQTPKGEYVYVQRRVPGRATRGLLAEHLPALIAEIPWPKSMRWGSLAFPFVRPIHWVLALFDGAVIPFEVAGVASGNTTRGHRFMSPEVREISGLQDYLQKMTECFVVISQQDREKQVQQMTGEEAGGVGGKAAQDPELLTTVANLVEYPSAVCCSFDSDFLKLPEAVLITAMKEHQKYFSVHDNQGKLMNRFVAINNTVARDETVVRRGHERVLRARLSDARFFFEEDRKKSLGDRLEDLKGVIYQADLGTSYAKVYRFAKLAEYLGSRFLPDRSEEIQTVAKLCKCDLDTEMVSEFPSLQGKMGEVYARLEGYPEEICVAVREHYLPDRAGGDLPTSDIAAVVGCADRMDTICGGFAVGLEPTGSADPFALRRHALAVLRIAEACGWALSLRDLIETSLSILAGEIHFERTRVFSRIRDFFRERYRQMMLREGYDLGLIEAVISVHFDYVDELRPRIQQLHGFARRSGEFQDLALTFKRISNILKKQEQKYKVNEGAFREECESSLWKAYGELKGPIEQHLARKQYDQALELLARLRTPVDGFFDGVEILIQDNQALRENRVGMLQHLAELFLKVADLSKFSV
jgi:glycyl-tRNA synthetase beta chain